MFPSAKEAGEQQTGFGEEWKLGREERGGEVL